MFQFFFLLIVQAEVNNIITYIMYMGCVILIFIHTQFFGTLLTIWAVLLAIVLSDKKAKR